MNKKIKIAMVAVVAAVAGMGIYSSQKDNSMSDIALANVEALARGEGLGDCDHYCTPNSNYGCIIMFGDGIDGITCYGYRKC